MKKSMAKNARIISLAMVAMLALSLAACSYTKPVKNAQVWYSFSDHCGNTVELSQKPEKVAVLFSSFADIWVAAGGTVDITVAESVERGFADSTAILVDGGAGKKINAELLVASKPDLVICSADVPAQQETAELLRTAGIPFALFSVESFEEYLGVLDIFTDITQNKDLYKTKGTDVKDRIDVLMNSIDKKSTPKKILFVRAGSGASATKAKTASQHFAAATLAELGTYNIAENAPVLLDGLSIEEIIIENPQYIFISTMGDETAAKEYINSLFSQPEWQVLTAVKNSNFIFLPKELFQYKPNSRWDEAYEYLTEQLYE